MGRQPSPAGDDASAEPMRRLRPSFSRGRSSTSGRRLQPPRSTSQACAECYRSLCGPRWRSPSCSRAIDARPRRERRADPDTDSGEQTRCQITILIWGGALFAYTLSSPHKEIHYLLPLAIPAPEVQIAEYLREHATPADTGLRSAQTFRSWPSFRPTRRVAAGDPGRL